MVEKISQAVLDRLTAEAKASPRLRMNLDLRNSAEDQSQRMLNAIEPWNGGTGTCFMNNRSQQ